MYPKGVPVPCEPSARAVHRCVSGEKELTAAVVGEVLGRSARLARDAAQRGIADLAGFVARQPLPGPTPAEVPGDGLRASLGV